MTDALDLAKAASIAALLLALAGIMAIGALLVGPATVRAELGYSFVALPRTLGEIVSILSNNLRMLAALFAACWTAQLALVADSGVRIWVRVMVALCDAAIVLAVAHHVVLVGAGVGAYSSRMIVVLLPHGPLELAAYALALALYLSARRERVDRDRWAATGTAAVVLLALAAPLEVLAR